MTNKFIGKIVAILSLAMLIASGAGIVQAAHETYIEKMYGVYDPQGQWILWTFLGFALICSVVGFLAGYEIGETKEDNNADN
jgi:cytochrome b subunit of formate dehydrogenase